MPLTADQRTARAKLAAHRRDHRTGPPADPAAAQLERDATDKLINELLARAPNMSDEQCAQVARLFGPMRQPAQ